MAVFPDARLFADFTTMRPAQRLIALSELALFYPVRDSKISSPTLLAFRTSRVTWSFMSLPAVAGTGRGAESGGILYALMTDEKPTGKTGIEPAPLMLIAVAVVPLTAVAG